MLKILFQNITSIFYLYISISENKRTYILQLQN